MDFLFPMHPYFQNMKKLGKPVTDKIKEKMAENKEAVAGVEATVAAEIDRVKNAGIPAEKIRSRGQMTIWDRIEYLVDKGSFQPLHTLYNPKQNVEGTTGVIDGLASINGKWCVIAGFDNKVMAGAWISGQAENQLRITDLAKRLHVPLVWLVNCSGVKLPEQEEVYADRRGNGTTFFRHAELEKEGIPIIAGIYGTNPAGGGYQAISPTVLFAHEKANMAVGGGGIVGGMAPKGGFGPGGRRAAHRGDPPTSRRFRPARLRSTTTKPVFSAGSMRPNRAFWMRSRNTWGPCRPTIRSFFRVDEPKAPAFDPAEIDYLVPFNQKAVYDFDNVLARLIDGSEHLEFKPKYGPRGLLRPGQDQRLPLRRDRQPPGFPGSEIPRVRRGRIHGHRRQTVPPGPDQDERVRHPVRSGPDSRFVGSRTPRASMSATRPKRPSCWGWVSR